MLDKVKTFVITFKKPLLIGLGILVAIFVIRRLKGGK